MSLFTWLAFRHRASQLQFATEWFERSEAIVKLVRSRNPRAIPLLEAAMNDPDERVRIGALRGLTKFNISGLSIIAKAVNSDDSVVKHEALQVIGNYEFGRWALPLLVDLLKSPQSQVVSAAEKALANIDKMWTQQECVRQSIPHFITALKDESSLVRHNAANVLRSIGDDSVIAPLVDLLSNGTVSSCSLNDSIRSALDGINPEWCRTSHAIAAIPSLIHALVHDSKDVRNDARTSLLHIDPKWMQRTDAQRAIPFLISALTHSDAVVGHDAKRALDSIDITWHESQPAQKAIPHLHSMLLRDDRDSRWLAIQVLERIRSVSSVAPLLTLVADVACHSCYDGCLSITSDVLFALDAVDARWPQCDVTDRIVDGINDALLHDCVRDPMSAVKVLERAGRRSSLMPLVHILLNRDSYASRRYQESLARAAVGALRTIDPEWAETAKDSGLVPEFLATIITDDTDIQVMSQVKHALGRDLELFSHGLHIAKRVEETVNCLIKRAWSLEPAKRRDCITALARIGPNAATAIPLFLDTIRKCNAKLEAVSLDNKWQSIQDEFWVVREAVPGFFDLGPDKAFVHSLLMELCVERSFYDRSTLRIFSYRVPLFYSAGVDRDLPWTNRAHEILSRGDK